MGIRLNIKSELPTAIKWTNQHTKQLPYSISQAINASVQGSKFINGSKGRSALHVLAVKSRRYLDDPKPQTQKGFRATVAKKSTLTSVIKTKDTKPYNMGRYLDQNILGGTRRAKYDALFVNHPTAKDMPRNSKLVPTKFLDKHKDKYGNVKKSFINKLYKSVGTGNRTGNNIFIGKPRGGARPAGVYRRERTYQLRALFIAQSTVTYNAIFPAKKEAENIITRTFGMYLRDQLQVNVSKELKRKGIGSF